MANTVNISLPPAQRAWLEGRRQTGQFTSTSDVVQDLIRQAQDAEQERLRDEFAALEKSSPGDKDSEPEAVVTRVARQAKRRNRLARGRA